MRSLLNSQDHNSSSVSVKEAADIIRKGGIVAFPTETVYGLGADGTSNSAVQKIYQLKGRPAENPLIIHLSDVEDVEKWIDLSESPRIKKQLEQLTPLWPGPLTVIFPKSRGICAAARAGRESIGIRIPDHPAALEFIRECKLPIAAPSANRSYYVSSTTPEHVIDCFGEELPIVDGGATQVGIESTIVKLSEEKPATILRPGSITKQTLSSLLSEEVIDEVITKHSSPTAPGQYERHYSPSTPVRLLSEQYTIPENGNFGLITFSANNELATLFEMKGLPYIELSPTGDLRESAQNLYSSLRKLDLLKLDLILVEDPPKEDIGEALRDRVKRAAG